MRADTFRRVIREAAAGRLLAANVRTILARFDLDAAVDRQWHVRLLLTGRASR